jgi:hypothetical protein
LRGRLFAKYPLFYAYIICVASGDVLMYVFYRFSPSHYTAAYWIVQFVTLIVGYGVILEILRQTLAKFPGANAFGTIVGFAALGIVFCIAIIQALATPDSFAVATTVELERDLRAVQAIFLVGIAAIISYYGITIGKNLRGMLFGYGLFIATSVMYLAMQSHEGSPFQAVLVIMQPFLYLVSLLIWVTALWSFHPNPAPQVDVQLEVDYEHLALRTRGMLGAMRSLLGKAARP